jgi:hypothetical protein
MIIWLNEFNYVHELLINFIAHLIIFIGAFYVALQNRKLPQWHITPLWYVGLFALTTNITIVFQWAIGPEFPMSYYNLGRLTETLLNVAVAAVAGIMLIGTIRRDIKYAKQRRQNQ